MRANNNDNFVLYSSYIHSENDIVWKLRQQYHCEKFCYLQQFKMCATAHVLRA